MIALNRRALTGRCSCSDQPWERQLTSGLTESLVQRLKELDVGVLGSQPVGW